MLFDDTNIEQLSRGPSGVMVTVPHILIEKLTLQYRTKSSVVAALEAVSMDIPPRSFVSIVGPSGCGKTTLLKVLSGVLRATRGRVLLDGRSIEEANLSGKIGQYSSVPCSCRGARRSATFC